MNKQIDDGTNKVSLKKNVGTFFVLNAATFFEHLKEKSQ